MWWYTHFVIIIWAISPGLRRLYDWKFGYSAFDVILIFPLLSTIPYIWSLTAGGGWKRLSREIAIIAWLWLGGFTYAFAISLVSGNVIPASFAFVSFIFPTALGLWVASDRARFAVAERRVTRILYVITTLTCSYGIIQYVFAPAWDSAWLQTVIEQGATSFGRPAPFQIRVFSTFNSPGTFAVFIAMMLLLTLPKLSLRRPLLLLQWPIWLIAIGITLVRTSWLMLAIGLLVYLILTPRRATLLVTLGVTIGLFSLICAVLPAVIGNATVISSLGDRLDTLSALDHDESAGQRAGLYSTAGTIIAQAPLGQGLGVIGVSTKLGKSEATTDFDSGLLGRFVEMGIPGFILYAAPLVLLLLGAIGLWSDGRKLNDPALQAFAAMAAGQACAFLGQQLASDAPQVISFVFWLIMCLALRARLDSRPIGEPFAKPLRYAAT